MWTKPSWLPSFLAWLSWARILKKHNLFFFFSFFEENAKCALFWHQSYTLGIDVLVFLLQVETHLIFWISKEKKVVSYACYCLYVPVTVIVLTLFFVSNSCRKDHIMYTFAFLRLLWFSHDPGNIRSRPLLPHNC